MTALSNYLTKHITGGFGIVRSFLIHLLLPYLLLTVLVVNVAVPEALSLILFVVIVGWGLVGAVVSCIKELLSSKAYVMSRILAGFLLTAMGMIVVMSLLDIVSTIFW